MAPSDYQTLMLPALRCAAENEVGIQECMASRFTPDALDAATHVKPQRIVLCDGERRATLMIEHGIGVRTERTIALKKLDLDYFEPEVD